MLTQILRWIVWQRPTPRSTITRQPLGQVHYGLISSIVTWKSGLLAVKRRIFSSEARKEKRPLLSLQDFLFSSIKLKVGPPSLKRPFVIPWFNLLWQLIR